MGILNRRKFLELAGAAAYAGVAQQLPSAAHQESHSTLHVPRLGTLAKVGVGGTADATIKRVHDLGLPTCQIFFEHLSLQQVNPLLDALKKYGVEATAVSEHNPG